MADDGLALIEHLALPDSRTGYGIGGYSLGGEVALRVMARGAQPTGALVAGVGLAGATLPAASGTNHRILTALARGDSIRPGTPEAQIAHWICHLGNDPTARYTS